MKREYINYSNLHVSKYMLLRSESNNSKFRMKTIASLTFVTLFIVLLSSCKNNLLDTSPYNAVSSATMWTNESLADQGVIGVYQTLRQDYCGLNLWYLDQEGFTAMNRDVTTLTYGNATTSAAIFTNYWKQNYEGISRANDAIKNLPNAPLTAEKMGRLVAECKFLRAWFYYNLNQVFKGVPVYLEPTALQDYTKARETEAAVWQIIITDLTDCINETNLPNFYAKGNTNWGRITKAAAYALRGKVYMWTKEYAKAEADLRKVGELGPTLFTGVYKTLFKQANEQVPEMIFSVQNIGVTGLGSVTQFYCGTRVSFGSCWNNYMPHPDFVESFENKDGSTFNWDTYLPGYSLMTPAQRTVFFLRDGLTATEITNFTTKGADMSKYLASGNEARLLKAFENRDPRLAADIITPYSTYLGSSGNVDYTYTLRWPYRGSDTSAPFDLRTDTNTKFYYLWRKWVYEGSSETPARNYGPTDQPLIRYADVVLLLAEAINEQGFKDEAVSLVNSVRTRAGAIELQSSDASKPTFVNSQSTMRERIRNERRWELCLEGVNYYDELRWETWKDKKFYTGNGTKEMWGTITIPYAWRGDYIYNWAIPQTEVEMNSNLIQNSGWIN